MVDWTDNYNEMIKRLGLGATGKFPEGKLCEHDEGELRTLLTVENGRIVLVFGKPVEFLAMTREQAEAIGSALLAKAKELP